MFNSRFILPLGFFSFIVYIIFLADSADYNFAFRLVGFIPYGDKIAHALLYGTLALFLNYALGFKTIKVFAFSMQIGALIVLAFAGLEELSQYFIPSRTCDIFDFLADSIGVTIFSLKRSRLWITQTLKRA